MGKGGPLLCGVWSREQRHLPLCGWDPLLPCGLVNGPQAGQKSGGSMCCP